MLNLKKAELLCNICGNILKDPINLPCFCMICHKHLKDDTVKNGLIKCLPCNDEFLATNIKVKFNRLAKINLEAEDYLSPDEKQTKREINDLLAQFQELCSRFRKEQDNCELNSHKKFAEIKRCIDIQREELKVKIDEFALAMIKQIEDYEVTFKQKLTATRNFKDFKLEEEKESLEAEFRKLELNIEHAKQLKTENEAKVQDLQLRIDEFKRTNTQIQACSFKPVEIVPKSVFGSLTLKKHTNLVSSSDDNTIKIWDLDSNECVRTLVGHSGFVNCVEILSNGQLISGSDDNTIKVWNSGHVECARTLNVNNRDVACLKVLSSNRVASSSKNDIFIWDINTGKCIRTLKGHTCWVRCLIEMPDGTLISCSQDKAIKFWNLSKGKCVKTLYGHSDKVFCLLLLKNGDLASGSRDKTVKIWNMESGECIRTLEGHTSWIWGLEFTEKHDLITCSSDGSIKIWSLSSGQCLKSLVGHEGGISSIKAFSSEVLYSGSYDNTIKVWDLTSGLCITTLTGHKDVITSLNYI